MHDCKQEDRLLNVVKEIVELKTTLSLFIQSVTDLIATVNTSIKEDRAKFDRHVYDGEKVGGYRDRLMKVESDISALKKAEWFRVIIAGLIGGLVANNTPDFFTMLMKLITRG
jgi:hypothetical protein